MKKILARFESTFKKGNSGQIKMLKPFILPFSIILFISVFSVPYVFAQDTSEEWVTIATTSNVVVSYRSDNCQGVDKLFLKIENHNSTTVNVKWSFWGEEVFKSISLNANETKIGDCNINAPAELDELIPLGKKIADIVSNIIVN